MQRYLADADRYASIWVQESLLTSGWLGRTARTDADIIVQTRGGSGFIIDECAKVTTTHDNAAYLLSAGRRYTFFADVSRLSLIYCELAPGTPFATRACSAKASDQSHIRDVLKQARMAVASAEGPVSEKRLLNQMTAAVAETFSVEIPDARCEDDFVDILAKVYMGEFDAVGEEGLLGAMVRESGLSERTLQTRFKKHMHDSPSSYVRNTRLDRARTELTRAQGPMQYGALAKRLGFQNPSRFATYYERRFGERPLDTIKNRTDH